MIIHLRILKRLKGGLRGRTRILTASRAVVDISAKENKDIGQFGLAVFHELLHVWTNLMKQAGAEIDMRKEHRFIYAMHGPLSQKVKLMRRQSND